MKANPVRWLTTHVTNLQQMYVNVNILFQEMFYDNKYINLFFFVLCVYKTDYNHLTEDVICIVAKM